MAWAQALGPNIARANFWPQGPGPGPGSTKTENDKTMIGLFHGNSANRLSSIGVLT